MSEILAYQQQLFNEEKLINHFLDRIDTLQDKALFSVVIVQCGQESAVDIAVSEFPNINSTALSAELLCDR